MAPEGCLDGFGNISLKANPNAASDTLAELPTLVVV